VFFFPLFVRVRSLFFVSTFLPHSPPQWSVRRELRPPPPPKCSSLVFSSVFPLSDRVSLRPPSGPHIPPTHPPLRRAEPPRFFPPFSLAPSPAAAASVSALFFYSLCPFATGVSFFALGPLLLLRPLSAERRPPMFPLGAQLFDFCQGPAIFRTPHSDTVSAIWDLFSFLAPCLFWFSCC